MLPWRDIKATALTEHPQFTCVQEQAVLTLPLPGGGVPTLQGMARGVSGGGAGAAGGG